MSVTDGQVVPQIGEKVKVLPSREYLNECFSYDPETGILQWKERPRQHFSSQRGHSCFNSTFKGREAGCMHSQGYLCVRLTFEGENTLHFCHRIIFSLLGVNIPDGKLVDHINGIRTDNRLSNLRIVDYSENSWNSTKVGLSSKRENLPRGVTKSSSQGKFTARIKHRGTKIHIGTFLTPEEASAAFTAKAIELRGEFGVIKH